MNLEIYQIFYSEKTREILDPSFIPLDNTQNNRSDWWEYWPIRNFLLNNELRDDTFYGFLSPRFHEKTNLRGSDFIEKVSESAAAYDVVNLSPYFDQAAFYQNAFEQLASIHSEYNTNFVQKILRCLDAKIEIKDIINTYSNTFYCNYFLAKKNFWHEWFAICEKIFELAEDNNSPLSLDLNKDIPYGNDQVAFKVFLIERIASYITSNNSSHRIYRDHNNSGLNYAKGNFNPGLHHNELLTLDSFKSTYLETKNPEYLSLFSEKRQELVNSLVSIIKPSKNIKKALIIAHYHKNGKIRSDTLEIVNLIANSFDRIIFISTGINPIEASKLPPNIEFYSRPNIGYDFYSYKIGLDLIYSNPDSWQISLMNTSFIVTSATKLVENYFLQKLTTDSHSLTISDQHTRHMQSYLMTFSESLSKSNKFIGWWKAMMPLDERDLVIERYELGLSKFLYQNEFDFKGIFPLEADKSLPNPTHAFYSELIDNYGVVKIEFLRLINQKFGRSTVNQIMNDHQISLNLLNEGFEN